VECKLKRSNFRREPDPRKAFRLAMGVTGISDNLYMSTMGAVVKCLGASGTVVKQMWESQTNCERCRIFMVIHSTYCRRCLRSSRCTRIIILSMYHALIIVHCQPLNYTIVPSISSIFHFFHRYITENQTK